MGDRDGELGLVRIATEPEGFICSRCWSTDIQIIKTENGVRVFCPRCENFIEGVFDDDDNPR
jgi:hypothetical protein